MMKHLFRKTAVLLLLLCAGYLYADTIPPKPPVITDTSCFKPLTFRGKPFFMLGNWDSRSERNYKAIDPFLQGAGMNTFIIGLNLEDEKTYQENMSLFRWFRDNHPEIAIIIELQVTFVYKQTGNKVFTAVPPAEIPARQEKLIAAVKELRTYGNILGYTIDEPENRLYSTLDDWRKANKKPADPNSDKDLAEYMVAAASWVVDSLKKYHPEAYYMPVLAWWTTYEHNEQLYDILMADEYPTAGQLDGYIYVAKDAQKAALATKKLNKQCFIYIPPGFNVLGGRWESRPFTREEIRYFWFNPITAGAMGIMGWRHRRTTPEFAMNVIYPVMNEIKSMTPWLLGENMDKHVYCSYGKEFYTQKIRKRSRMVENEVDEFDYRHVRSVTYILRRNPADGSYLLLVANNTPQPVEFYFVLDKTVNVSYALELFSQKTTGGVIGKFKMQMKPFEVKAYLMPDKERQNK